MKWTRCVGGGDGRVLGVGVGVGDVCLGGGSLGWC